MNMRLIGLVAFMFVALQGGFSSSGASVLPQPDGRIEGSEAKQDDQYVFIDAFMHSGSAGLDVPYVPTPQPVVDEMLRMAKVTKDDILYDLGCGDGRIVITAAKNMGARGIGVDIDPVRIKESKKNAADSKVTDRVRFLQQDLFKMDFSDATVLTLYLLPSVNRQLRPKILRDLKPGTRIVSHQFTMDDWEPDLSTKVQTSNIYYWVVPANVTGTWEVDAVSGIHSGLSTLELKQKFQKVSGTFASGAAPIPMEHVELQGDKIKFTVMKENDGRSVPMRFEGRVSGNVMEGNVEWEEKPGEGTRKWRANRDPSTVSPLDGDVTVQASVPLFMADRSELYEQEDVNFWAQKDFRLEDWDWTLPARILLQEHLDGQ